MWGKILGALFGLAIFRIPGLILGVMIGHWFDQTYSQKFEQNGGFSGLFNENPDEQALFRYTTFSTMGHIAKAAGVVTQAHIQQALHFMAQLDLSPEQQKEAQAAFRDGKLVSFPLRQQLQLFYQVYRRRKEVLQLFLEIQISTACLQGKMADGQYQLLQQVAGYLNVSSVQLDRLLQAYGTQSRQQQGTSKLKINDAYRVLGVDSTINETGLKRAYRKLMSQHHPDKLMAQGVPAEMLEIAKQRTQDIQAAYELIKRQRSK
ncbi:co-chaperone DjlA [Rheinheimera sp. MMS21-TC3]|uniref:co-chaperone DjlA n=1 Tax=Rheinheimera sp. MMS21-TC3 TaxID=3072790 RepID=UPI0028C49D33|nr:co-chaperone DjlA [Rheinheimera sp. MMS21-TC3]WNO62139.1 co-chaperone DjlA [Rheinheimera sp. MMS21-TC3]